MTAGVSGWNRSVRRGGEPGSITSMGPGEANLRQAYRAVSSRPRSVNPYVVVSRHIASVSLPSGARWTDILGVVQGPLNTFASSTVA